MFVSDKLNIFISSTIHECSEERQNAGAAIKSINHHPILFEDFGARPHPPRAMYMKGIEESHIFIAIYNESYGWSAEGMDISGIEDEYNLACSKGLSKLIYIKADAQRRDPRLVNLITKIEQSKKLTYSFYKKPTDLLERIREDVTAEISNKFLMSSASDNISFITATEFIEGIMPERKQVIDRISIEEEIERELAKNPFLSIYGPLGCGKSVLLALFAEKRNYSYINAKGKSSKEVIGRCANLIEEDGSESIFTDIESSSQAFIRTWKRSTKVNLVIDSFDDYNLIIQLISEAGGCSEAKKIIISIPGTQETLENAYLVPPFNKAEIEQFINTSRQQTITQEELEELEKYSGGNPLYLKYYTMQEPGTFEQTLFSFESKAWNNLPNTTKEALSYIVFSDIPLSLENIQDLLGERTSIEDVYSILSKGQHLLKTTGRYYDIFHEHFRNSILTILNKNQQKMSYYSGRLGSYLYKKGHIVSAFMILDRASDPAAQKFLNEAAFIATVRGETGRAIYIFSRKLAIARENADHEESLSSLLTLAKLKQDASDNDGSLECLTEAEKEAEDSKNSLWTRIVQENKLFMEALLKGDKSSLADLLKLKKECEANEDYFAVAKICVDLSVIYIKNISYEEAVKEARIAKEIFEKMGDEYGLEIAKSNLISALSALPDYEDEFNSIFKEVSAAIDPEKDPRRRAFICNILNRIHRREGRLDLAKKYANEAIEIAKKLGDDNLLSVHLINLGNVYRDEDDDGTALECYKKVEEIAVKSKYKLLEADARTLISSIYNSKKEFELAFRYASSSIELLKNTTTTYRLSRSYQERASALQNLGLLKDAILDYLEGARILFKDLPNENLFFDLFKSGLLLLIQDKNLDEIDNYLTKIFYDEKEELGANEKIPAFERIIKKIPFILNYVPLDETAFLWKMVFKLLFEEFPNKLKAKISMKILSRWLSNSELNLASNQSLIALAILLLSILPEQVSSSELIEVAEKISEKKKGLYFKPHLDGTQHWTIKLDLAKPVICTIDQLDAGKDIALISFIIALFLKGLDKEIQSRIMLSETFSRTEISIMIGSVKELQKKLDLNQIGLNLPMEHVCLVPRTTDPIREDQPPLLVICREDICEQIQSGKQDGSALKILLGVLLYEMIFQLFNGKIEAEVLKPKLLSIIRMTIYE